MSQGEVEGDLEARRRRALARLTGGDLSGAEAETLALLRARPGDAGLLNQLGVIQKRQGRLAAAIATFHEGSAANPADATLCYNLGNSLIAAGQPSQAVEPLRRALDLQVDSAETARLLGMALAADGRFGQAYAAFDRAERLEPNNPRLFASRAGAMRLAGAPVEAALAEIDRAIALDPEGLEPLREKAALLQQFSRFDEALAAHQAVLARAPDDVETLLRLGLMLGYSLQRYEDANLHLRRAADLKPDDPRVLSMLCKSLLDSRYGVEADHLQEAGVVARKLLDLGGDLAPMASNLIGVFLRLADFDGLEAVGDPARLMAFWVERMNVGALHNQLARVVSMEDRRALLAWHRAWGEKVEASAARAPPRRPSPARRSGGKIRIGLMSSDLRDHPVAYFALPLIERYDRARFELIAYSFHPAPPDRVQTRVRARVDGFRSLLQATDAEIAQTIADDRLDILFELGGTTRYNRLEVLAHRPAPIQASWLGYPHSAGLSAIDHVLVDPFLKPEDPALLLERPLVMPESWVVFAAGSFPEHPIEAGTPQARAGAVTFGTLNNPYKYTREIFRLWSEVMARTPGSRFLFVRPEGGAESFRANVRREFARHGVDPERILFEPVRGRHMPHYNRVDIALDCAPQTGGTTTCEALWMGVPTVSLVGPALFERLSFSLLTNAGLGDLCATSSEAYVDIAVALAADEARRADLRASLRGRIRDGVLGDEARWVRHFEALVAERLGKP